MTFTDLSLVVSRSALVATFALLTPACAVDVDAEPEGVEEELGTAELAGVSAQCVAYRRGVSGTVADATLWQDASDWNDSDGPLIHTGTSSAGFRQALLHVDISNIPADVHVDSAVLYLSELYKDEGSTVYAHRVTAPWSESSVTWDNFNGAFDPSASASVYAWGGGTAQMHVEGLVQQWIDGTPNHGLLLQEGGQIASQFRSSEHGTIDSRPRLKVCYSPNP